MSTEIDPFEKCVDMTVEALGVTRVADQREILQGAAEARESMARNQPRDILECVARAQGHQEEFLGREVEKLAHAVAYILEPSPPIIPFAAKLIAPSSFYESYTAVHEMGRKLMAPVLFAEDTDSLGVGALNPIAAKLLGEFIQATMSRRTGVRPFITIVRMEYETWTFLTRKHFDLNKLPGS